MTHSPQDHLTIRPLAPGDRAQWGALWRDYLIYYETRLPDRIHDLAFARYCDPAHSSMFAFVAEQNGQLLGLVHNIIHEHGWKEEQIVYLQDLFTRPEARGTGVGKALIEAVYAHADAQGLGGVYWLTQEFNTTARRLYDHVGQVTPFIKYQRR